MKFKKKLFLLSVIVLISVIIYSILDLTLYDYLKLKLGGKQYKNIELIKELETIENYKICFYCSNSGNTINVAVAKPSPFNILLNRNMCNLLKRRDEPYYFSMSSFNEGKSSLVWGIVNDINIKNIYIDDKKLCSISSNNDFRIFYILNIKHEKNWIPNFQVEY